MKKFNINNYIYIQITKRGWKHLSETLDNSYIENCIKNKKVEIDDEIWYKLQCYEVFQLFVCEVGSEPMFETNVMFDDRCIEN